MPSPAAALVQLHPIMVHFPLALIIIGAVCLLCGRTVREGSLRSSLAVAGTWNLILGGATILLSLATGILAVAHLHLTGGAQYSVSRHVLWAVCTSQLVIFLAIWRGVACARTSRPSWLFLVLLFTACAGLVVTGYHGGENVYHYEIGIEH